MREVGPAVLWPVVGGKAHVVLLHTRFKRVISSRTQAGWFTRKAWSLTNLLRTLKPLPSLRRPAQRIRGATVLSLRLRLRLLLALLPGCRSGFFPRGRVRVMDVFYLGPLDPLIYVPPWSPGGMRRVAPPPQLARPDRLYGLGTYRGDLRARAADSYNSLKSHIRSSLLYRISYIATARQRRFDAVCGHRRKYFFRSPQKLRGVFYLYVPQRLSP